MLRSEKCYTREEVNSKVKQLEAKGCKYEVTVDWDYEACEDMSISCFVVTWEE